MAIDIIGCPLAEALNLTQLTLVHVTELETDTTETSLSTALQREWSTQDLDVFMTNSPSCHLRINQSSIGWWQCT
jgi:hypothetical protein